MSFRVKVESGTGEQRLQRSLLETRRCVESMIGNQV